MGVSSSQVSKLESSNQPAQEEEHHPASKPTSSPTAAPASLSSPGRSFDDHFTSTVPETSVFLSSTIDTPQHSSGWSLPPPSRPPLPSISPPIAFDGSPAPSHSVPRLKAPLPNLQTTPLLASEDPVFTSPSSDAMGKSKAKKSALFNMVKEVTGANNTPRRGLADDETLVIETPHTSESQSRPKKSSSKKRNGKKGLLIAEEAHQDPNIEVPATPPTAKAKTQAKWSTINAGNDAHIPATQDEQPTPERVEMGKSERRRKPRSARKRKQEKPVSDHGSSSSSASSIPAEIPTPTRESTTPLYTRRIKGASMKKQIVSSQPQVPEVHKTSAVHAGKSPIPTKASDSVNRPSSRHFLLQDTARQAMMMVQGGAVHQKPQGSPKPEVYQSSDPTEKASGNPSGNRPDRTVTPTATQANASQDSSQDDIDGASETSTSEVLTAMDMKADPTPNNARMEAARNLKSERQLEVDSNTIQIAAHLGGASTEEEGDEESQSPGYDSNDINSAGIKADVHPGNPVTEESGEQSPLVENEIDSAAIKANIDPEDASTDAESDDQSWSPPPQPTFSTNIAEESDGEFAVRDSSVDIESDDPMINFADSIVLSSPDVSQFIDDQAGFDSQEGEGFESERTESPEELDDDLPGDVAFGMGNSDSEQDAPIPQQSAGEDDEEHSLPERSTKQKTSTKQRKGKTDFLVANDRSEQSFVALTEEPANPRPKTRDSTKKKRDKKRKKKRLSSPALSREELGNGDPDREEYEASPDPILYSRSSQNLEKEKPKKKRKNSAKVIESADGSIEHREAADDIPLIVSNVVQTPAKTTSRKRKEKKSKKRKSHDLPSDLPIDSSRLNDGGDNPKQAESPINAPQPVFISPPRANDLQHGEAASTIPGPSSQGGAESGRGSRRKPNGLHLSSRPGERDAANVEPEMNQNEGDPSIQAPRARKRRRSLDEETPTRSRRRKTRRGATVEEGQQPDQDNLEVLEFEKHLSEEQLELDATQDEMPDAEPLLSQGPEESPGSLESPPPANSKSSSRQRPRKQRAKPSIPESPTGEPVNVRELKEKATREVLPELPGGVSNDPPPRMKMKAAGAVTEAAKPVSLADGTFREGPFTDEEKAAFARVVETHRVNNYLTQFEVNQLVQDRPNDSDNHVRLWNAIIDAVRFRNKKKLVKYGRKNFHNFVARGKWTEDQDEELRRMTQKHGEGKWTVIAQEINRHPEDVRDRWRDYISCGRNRNVNAWSPEEETELIDNVVAALRKIQATMNKKGSISTGSIAKLLDWRGISTAIGGKRSRAQCSQKWERLSKNVDRNQDIEGIEEYLKADWRLQNARVEYGQMTMADKISIVKGILKANISREYKIRWKQCVPPRIRQRYSQQSLQLAWFRMKTRVPNYKNKPIVTICKRLIRMYDDDNESFADNEVEDDEFDSIAIRPFKSLEPTPQTPRRKKQEEGTTRTQRPKDNTLSTEFVQESDLEGDEPNTGYNGAGSVLEGASHVSDVDDGGKDSDHLRKGSIDLGDASVQGEIGAEEEPEDREGEDVEVHEQTPQSKSHRAKSKKLGKSVWELSPDMNFEASRSSAGKEGDVGLSTPKASGAAATGSQVNAASTGRTNKSKKLRSVQIPKRSREPVEDVAFRRVWGPESGTEAVPTPRKRRKKRYSME
ncbi:multidrug resistance-associated protein [Zalerion maritima]|uniref:Multidrug resistance-associated protein n=1 Tax=Zalerion maritima TaxID=339359 RepID=A0AAD5RXD7_9PEZI|nr:multidrug resistance-associated protein [Zalerion maritima]